MKRGIFLALVSVSLVFLVAGGAFAWQGRMAGMGDPSGLIEDESDYLVHPTKIVDGSGVRLYGHYRFTYDSVQDWNYDTDLSGGLLGLVPGLSVSWDIDNDGREYRHDALLGGAFPVGSGRMAIFFTYKGKFGSYDGDESLSAGLSSAIGPIGPGSASINFDNDMESDLNDFALRFLYGVPVGSIRLGAELDVGYVMEENEWDSALSGIAITGVPAAFLSGIGLEASNWPVFGLDRFLIPYDQEYWKILFKLGANWSIGTVQFDLTPRGGALFGGDNSWDHYARASVGPPITAPPFIATNAFDMNGDVSGWLAGFDFWLRFPINRQIDMPFVVRLDYKKKDWDGDGTGRAMISQGPNSATSPPLRWEHDAEETTTEFEAGGGFDIDVSKYTKTAIGFYYNYMKSEIDLEHSLGIPIGAPVGVVSVLFDQGGYPEVQEHRVSIRLSGEHMLSPTLSLRGGLSGFYGWVDQEYNIDLGAAVSGPTISGAFPGLIGDRIELDGYRWGILASFGATAKFSGVVLEPFLNGGYTQLNVDGDEFPNIVSGIFPPGIPLAVFDPEMEKSEAFVGVGFSLLFDM